MRVIAAGAPAFDLNRVRATSREAQHQGRASSCADNSRGNGFPLYKVYISNTRVRTYYIVR